MIKAGVQTMMHMAVWLLKRKVQPAAPMMIEAGSSRSRKKKKMPRMVIRMPLVQAEGKGGPCMNEKASDAGCL
jgi:hypothetical protein